jgi:hypothetical protein
VLEGPRLVLRENHDLPRPLGESLEQLPRSFQIACREPAWLPGSKGRVIVADWSRAESHTPGSPGVLGTLLGR